MSMGNRLSIFTVIVFAGIAFLIALDLATDQGEGAGLVHLAIEGAALIAALIGAILTLRTLRRTTSQLTLARAEADRWQSENRELLRGLTEAIGKQFVQWGLSPAEQEIGYLLLKGLSMDEVAKVRGTSERTARDQARAIYRKASVSGRAELSAFFLEDLLVAPVNQA